MFERLLMACVVIAVPVAAQKVETFEKKVERTVELKGADNMVFLRSPAGGGVPHTMEFRNFLVKGAPYSAEAVTETVQTLADGNRIVNRQSGKEYRDSEGRTRHDRTIAPLGPWVAEGKSMTMTLIDDPVSGEHITLNHDEKTANRMRMPQLVHVSEGGGQKEIQVEIRHGVEAKVEHDVHVTTTVGPREVVTAGALVAPSGGAPAMSWVLEDSGPAKPEALGKRVIEGVECEGTKVTLTIETGKIGNDRPIETVTERWHSPDLKVDVLRKHSDPRFGTTEYRLQGIVRGEQPRSLFEPPSDYKVQELGGATTFKMRRDKE